MRLTAHADYALRLLMYLAVQEDELITISASAEHYGISKNHLMKVAHKLGQLGYIETVRGRSGGLRLARDANSINIGDVVREIEVGDALVACFPNGSGGCLISPSCRLKGILAEAIEAFFQSLDQFTLANLVDGNNPLKKALSLDPK